jgi:pilus assembly protein CpaC
MINVKMLRRALAATVATALVAGLAGAPLAAAGGKPGARAMARVAQLPTGAQRPTTEVQLSVGQGELINLPTAITNVWTSNPTAADVYVSNPRQIHLFGKEFGEATVFATSASGAVVYATNVRVSQNINSIDKMLKLAMPDADIKVTIAGQAAVMTGTVASPQDAEEAEMLVRTILNPGIDTSQPGGALKIIPVNRLRTATPLQVNLQVRIAEVSREVVKEIGVNLLTRDQTGGFLFGIAQGRQFGSIGNVDTSAFPRLDASSLFGLPAGSISLPFNPSTGQFVAPNSGTSFNLNQLGQGAGRTNLGLAGRLFGIDVASALDLFESEGLVTTLANPNLTALSGETASFLAGGEIPIPLAQGLGQIGVEYKQYGVSLAFTPTVLADGRISMRVRPEVSELTTAGAVTIQNFQIPALTTRRAETTVELGSGQSFMIAGLLTNRHSNLIERAPGLGDVPVLGALFRSSRFRKAETELVIIITPYLVKPSNGPLPLPTDGYKAATDPARVLLGQSHASGDTGSRPVPTLAPPATGGAPAAPAPAETGAVAPAAPTRQAARKGDEAPAPGFSLK